MKEGPAMPRSLAESAPRQVEAPSRVYLDVAVSWPLFSALTRVRSERQMESAGGGRGRRGRRRRGGREHYEVVCRERLKTPPVLLPEITHTNHRTTAAAADF